MKFFFFITFFRFLVILVNSGNPLRTFFKVILGEVLKRYLISLIIFKKLK